MRIKLLASTLLLFSFSFASEPLADDVKMLALPSFGPVRRPGRWMPVAFLIENNGPQVRGTLRVVERGARVTIAAKNVVVPPHSKTRHFLYAKCRSSLGAGPLIAQLISEKGKHLTADFEMSARPIYCDLFIGTIGQEKAGLGAFTFRPGFDKSRGSKTLITSLRCKPQFLPDRWKGYDVLDVLIWPNPCPSALSPPQQRAIEMWVRAGGRLLVSAGSDWTEMRGTFLEGLLPGKVTGTKGIPASEWLARFCSANPPKGLVVACQLENVVGKVLCEERGLPLVVQAERGFGEVTLVAFDVTRQPLAKWEGMGQFWRKILRIPEEKARNAGVGRPPDFYPGREIQKYLADIGVLSSISFRWIAWFVVIYILLVGPADYFVLKRFNKLRWTWVTFPVLVVLFSTISFWRSYSAKGGDMILKRLSIVDVPHDSGLTKGEDFFIIFSPKNTRYQVAFSEMSVFVSLWEYASFTRRGGLSGQTETETVQNRGMQLKDIAINKWSTEQFHAYWVKQAQTIEPIQADLAYDGSRVGGEVVNNSHYDFQEAFLAYKDRVIRLGQPSKDHSARVEGVGIALSDFLRSSTSRDYSRAGRRPYESIELYKEIRTVLLLSFTPKSRVTDLYGDYSSLSLTDELEGGKTIFLGFTKQQPVDIIIEGSKPKETGICAVRIVLE